MCVQAVHKDWDQEVCLHSTSGWHPLYLWLMKSAQAWSWILALSGLEWGPYRFPHTAPRYQLTGWYWFTFPRKLWVSQVQELCLMWISQPHFTPLTLTSIYLCTCRTFLEDHPRNWQRGVLQGKLEPGGSGRLTLPCAILDIWPWT